MPLSRRKCLLLVNISAIYSVIASKGVLSMPSVLPTRQLLSPLSVLTNSGWCEAVSSLVLLKQQQQGAQPKRHNPQSEQHGLETSKRPCHPLDSFLLHLHHCALARLCALLNRPTPPHPFGLAVIQPPLLSSNPPSC